MAIAVKVTPGDISTPSWTFLQRYVVIGVQSPTRAWPPWLGQ